MTFRRAVEQDFSQMKEIFLECFGDTQEYTDFFYRETKEQVVHYLLEDNGEIFSMLTVFPVHLFGDREEKGGYIYGVATPKKYRGKGYMKQLMSCVEQVYTQSLDFLCLVPAGEVLFSMYGALGYEVCSFLGAYGLAQGEPCENTLVQQVSLEEYFEKRQDYFSRLPCGLVFSDEEYLKKELSLTQCSGVEIQGNYFLYYQQEDKIIVRESLVFHQEYLGQISALKKQGQDVLVRGHGEEGKKIPYAMKKSCSTASQEIYMNLMLD